MKYNPYPRLVINGWTLIQSGQTMTHQYHDKFFARIIIFIILFNFEIVRTTQPLFNTNEQYTKEKIAFDPMEKREDSLTLFRPGGGLKRPPP